MSRESYLARERKRFAYDKAYFGGVAVGAIATGLIGARWWFGCGMSAAYIAWSWFRLPKDAR